MTYTPINIKSKTMRLCGLPIYGEVNVTICDKWEVNKNPNLKLMDQRNAS